MSTDESKLLTISHAARRLGVAENSVRRMDALLRPTRDSSGRRLYNANTVEIVALERAQRASRKTGGES